MGFGGVTAYGAWGFSGGPALLNATKRQISTASIFITGAMSAQNASTGDCYLLIYDALAANVTVGTTIPKFIIPIMKNTALNFQPSKVLEMSNALTVAMVMTDPKGTTDPSAPFGIDIYTN